MSNLIQNIFSLRSVLGTFLLIILIGEPSVGVKTGLFTPDGFVIFFFLYLSLFHLFDSLIATYRLVFVQVILLTFAIYSVLVTGLLHKELTEYILTPNLFTTLIRIQASFFAAFAFYLLNAYTPRNLSKVLTINQSLILFIGFICLMSLGGKWGIPALFFTLKTVPALAIFYIFLAILAVVIAFTIHPKKREYKSTMVIFIIVCNLILGVLPTLPTFFILVIGMIFSGIYFLTNSKMRNALL